jgi:hypothetical protein
MKDVGFHVLHEQIHILPLPYFESFHWWINIMLLIDCIHTSIDLVIVNPTWVDLILQVVFCHMVAMTMVSHAKLFYYDWHSTYAFFPLVIKVFGCLHQQANNFLYQCANMVRLAKGFGGPPLGILHAFYQ